MLFWSRYCTDTDPGNETTPITMAILRFMLFLTSVFLFCDLPIINLNLYLMEHISFLPTNDKWESSFIYSVTVKHRKCCILAASLIYIIDISLRSSSVHVVHIDKLSRLKRTLDSWSQLSLWLVWNECTFINQQSFNNINAFIFRQAKHLFFSLHVLVFRFRFYDE